MEWITQFLIKNGLILAFLTTGLIMFLSNKFSERFLNKKIPGAAIAIAWGLVLAFIGGKISGGKNGIADVGPFSGFTLLGGSMLRDFTIVATAMGASFVLIRRAGWAGVAALLIGVTLTFFAGAVIAFVFGYRDAASITTIGAGACTFIVGPVTGAAIGANSEVIALSIGAGVIKSILVTIGTPIVAKRLGINNPHSAMIFGGMLGTTSGVAAGLAATDPKLAPYGALTATFYTGLGCLLCPSVLYLIVNWLV